MLPLECTRIISQFIIELPNPMAHQLADAQKKSKIISFSLICWKESVKDLSKSIVVYGYCE